MPNLFILRLKVSPLEKSRARFLGEEDVCRWESVRFRNYLQISWIIELTSFSGMENYLNHSPMYPVWYTNDETNFCNTNFLICHFSARMVWECYILS